MSRAIHIPAGTTDLPVLAAGCTLVGYNFWETAAAAATLQVRNGTKVWTLTEGGAGLTSFTLTYGGQTTGSLDDQATPEQIKTALELLSNVADGEATVTGPPGGPYVVKIGGTQYGLDQTLTATPTGGTGTVTVTVVDPLVVRVALAANGNTGFVAMPSVDCPNGVYLVREPGTSAAVFFVL